MLSLRASMITYRSADREHSSFFSERESKLTMSQKWISCSRCLAVSNNEQFARQGAPTLLQRFYSDFERMMILKGIVKFLEDYVRLLY